MAKLPRKHQKILGSSSSNSGQFGSARAGTFVTSADIDVLQSLSAWGQGWNQVTVSGDKLPPLEEMQAVDYVVTSQLAYIMQEGLAEYSSDTEYFENSLVKESGTVKIYKSLTDNNQGNLLTDVVNWEMVLDLDSGGVVASDVTVSDASFTTLTGTNSQAVFVDVDDILTDLALAGSGAATDGQVLTADGAGGSVYGETVQEIRAIPQNIQSGAYTLLLSDGGKHILHPSADTTARTWTIPANASVAYPIGTAITFINQNGAGVITIAITSDTMRLADDGATGSRTLAANGIATAIKITTTEWLISGAGLS